MNTHPKEAASVDDAPENGVPEQRGIRINKYIAETGHCSRREAEKLVGERRVSVNGEPARLATLVMPGDEVRVDGEVLRKRSAKPGKRRHVYIALNKPVGVTCTSEPSVKGNIVDFVDHEQRIFPVGRLDKDSEGLILLTSNGDIVNQILRKENAREKEYLVAVNKPVTEEFLRGMARGGIPMHGQQTLPCRVQRHGKLGFRIVLTQGLNRQIRLMCQAFGYRVKQLRRTRIDNLRLAELKPGRWRNLTDAELRGLLPNQQEW